MTEERFQHPAPQGPPLGCAADDAAPAADLDAVDQGGLAEPQKIEQHENNPQMAGRGDLQGDVDVGEQIPVGSDGCSGLGEANAGPAVAEQEPAEGIDPMLIQLQENTAQIFPAFLFPRPAVRAPGIGAKIAAVIEPGEVGSFNERQMNFFPL
jgi:hypothetical protein